jgi:protein involved in polysaccharide export with SLBB domain
MAAWMCLFPLAPFAQAEGSGPQARGEHVESVGTHASSATDIKDKKVLGAADKTSVKTSENKKSKTAEAGAPEAETAIPEENNYPKLVIGPGDLLSIHVYGESTGASGNSAMSAVGTLPTQYQVDSEGLIVFPFLDRVRMAGLTPAEASEKLARLLSKPRKVTVLIQESNTFWVSVMGNVGKPGKYQIRGRPTLLSALAEAGGPLPNSDMGGAMLMHKNNKVRVNLDEFLRGEGLTKPEPYLYPGDVLMVQKSSWPTLGEVAIITSILASAVVITVQLDRLNK